jgi:hypothetical protein
LFKGKCALCGFYLGAKSRHLFVEGALGNGSDFGWCGGGAEIQFPLNHWE